MVHLMLPAGERLLDRFLALEAAEHLHGELLDVDLVDVELVQVAGERPPGCGSRTT